VGGFLDVRRRHRWLGGRESVVDGPQDGLGPGRDAYLAVGVADVDFTKLMLKSRVLPISWLLRPAATSPSTSDSRGVRPALLLPFPLERVVLEHAAGVLLLALARRVEPLGTGRHAEESHSRKVRSFVYLRNLEKSFGRSSAAAAFS
jgi:hypothetical protein